MSVWSVQLLLVAAAVLLLLVVHESAPLLAGLLLSVVLGLAGSPLAALRARTRLVGRAR